MKKKKTNKIIILGIIGVVLITSLVIFILNYSKDDTSFSILEKKWINDNSSSVIDVSAYNDIPIYGKNGTGVIFDYLDQFSDSYGVNFNKVSYLSSTTSNLKDIAFMTLRQNEDLTDNDILMYKDEYVLATKDLISVNEIKDINNSIIGTLNSDLNNVNYYLYDSVNTSYKSYDDIDTMVTSLNNGDITAMVVPMNMYLQPILENDLYISYHFSDLNIKYVLRINNNNTLLNIMKKYNTIFENNYKLDSYKTNFLNTFFSAKGLSEEEKTTYNNSSYVYGYVVNMPYENQINNDFVGILSNYLKGFEDLTNTDFKIIKYNSVSELKDALSRGEVDVAFANYNANNLNIDIINTTSLFKEQYVVLAENNLLIDSMRSLKNKEVSAVNNTFLFDNLTSSGVKVKSYNNTDELLRNINNSSVVVIDMDTYTYYKNRKLKDYKIVYTGTLPTNYNFVVRDVNKNSTFSELFMYYTSSINYNTYKYSYNTEYIVIAENGFNTILKYLVISLLVIFSVVIIVISFLKSKKKKKKEVITKEDKYKFIDIMTSLKNRNYLNYNIKTWEENVIYPQSILVIDLNNIKYINDNYGHEEGDNVIKKAASILIVNQKEKSDIIRTDGNEFLIYMVGYDENSIISYIRKLNKELKELPHGFGATIGYSMITDDIKSIDDAINEATLSMRSAKEKETN